MFWNVVLLIVGMALLVKGADWFVEGSSNIAKALKIPSLIIGLTLVSMGTSMPEASVSIQSAIKGNADISIGNIVGSNIFNTLFILGASALFVPILIDRDMKLFDIPIMVGIYGVLAIFSFVITPNAIERWEAIIILVLFIAYMAFLIMRAKKNKPLQPQEIEDSGKKRPMWLYIIFTVVGLASIVFGGTLTVNNAEQIALKLGMSQTLVGLTICAVGTSLPELVTSVVAAIKKENDIAVGNVIGSNVFNVLFILGSSAIISPLSIGSSVAMGTLIDVGVMALSGILIMAIAFFSKKMRKWQGAIFFLLYVGYLTYIIIRN